LTTDVFGLSLAAKDGEIWNNPYAFFPHENDVRVVFMKIMHYTAWHPTDSLS
jgi:hypothetical protein